MLLTNCNFDIDAEKKIGMVVVVRSCWQQMRSGSAAEEDESESDLEECGAADEVMEHRSFSKNVNGVLFDRWTVLQSISR